MTQREAFYAEVYLFLYEDTQGIAPTKDSGMAIIKGRGEIIIARFYKKGIQLSVSSLTRIINSESKVTCV